MTQTETVRKTKSPIPRMVLSLFLIAALCSAVLAVVNDVTKDRIAELDAQNITDAMLAVMPDADAFEDIDSLPEGISAMKGAYKDGQLIGWCVTVEPVGFGGTITMVVGVFDSLSVSGISIVSMSETPSLGMKAKDAAFLDQFKGVEYPVELGTDDGIDAITSATITSRAVTDGVNLALKAAGIVKGGASQ